MLCYLCYFEGPCKKNLFQHLGQKGGYLRSLLCIVFEIFKLREMLAREVCLWHFLKKLAFCRPQLPTHLSSLPPPPLSTFIYSICERFTV
jgi:hypothetical protein